MKRLIFAVFIIILTYSGVFALETKAHKVIKVVDGDTIYIDFNDNGIPEHDEKVRINGIDTFETKLGEHCSWQIENFNITQKQVLGMGYLAKEFAKKELLNKPVKAVYSADTKFDKNQRHLMSIYYSDKNYEQEVLKQGLAVVYTKSNLAPELEKYRNQKKLERNFKKAERLDLVLLNTKNGKYHEIDCEYATRAAFEIIKRPLFAYKKANCCHLSNSAIMSDYYSNSIEIYFLNPIEPNQHPTSALNRLLSLINNCNKRIYFAIYGISNQSIINALLKKYNQGIDIKWVTDVNKFGKNNYSKTIFLQEHLPNYRTDYNEDELKISSKQVVEFYIKNQNIKTQFDDSEIEYFTDQLMHNKFFIFDDNIVTTGSANISNTGISGRYINANDFIVIKSKIINEIYAKEFNQMYNGSFHKDKIFIPNKKNIKLDDETTISIYFSPNDYTFKNDVINIINKSKKFIYVAMFYFTDKDITQALINAKERGVDVKVILDASSATGNYSKHKVLRIAGIPVKVENWSGKMHMKSLITENQVVTGSLNWTSRAQKSNDENSLIIKNPIIANTYKKNFIKLYKSIPDKWLYHDPKPEGKDSPHSCNDGLDNDHDGFIDMNDIDCNPNANQGKPYSKYYENLE